MDMMYIGIVIQIIVIAVGLTAVYFKLQAKVDQILAKLNNGLREDLKEIKMNNKEFIAQLNKINTEHDRQNIDLVIIKETVKDIKHDNRRK